MRGAAGPVLVVALAVVALGHASATPGTNFDAFLRLSRPIEVPLPADLGVRLNGILLTHLDDLAAGQRVPRVDLGPTEITFSEQRFQSLEIGGRTVPYSTTPGAFRHVWNVSAQSASIEILAANAANQVWSGLTSPTKVLLDRGTACGLAPMEVARFENPEELAAEVLGAGLGIDRTGANLRPLQPGVRLQVLCRMQSLQVDHVSSLQFAGFRIGLRYLEVGAQQPIYRILETRLDVAPNSTVPNTHDHDVSILHVKAAVSGTTPLDAAFRIEGPQTTLRLWAHTVSAAGQLLIPPFEGEASWKNETYQGSRVGLSPRGAFLAVAKGPDSLQLSGQTTNEGPRALAPSAWWSGSVEAGAVAVGTAAGVAAIAWRFRLLAAALFTRLTKDHALDHPRRRAVLDAVTHNPGLRTKDLSDLLQMSRRVVDHHVNVLVRQGLLVRRNVGRATAFFVRPPADPRLAQRLALARSASARKIVKVLAIEPSATQRTVAARVGLSQPYVSYLLRRLCEAGVLERAALPGRPGYVVVDVEHWNDETAVVSS